MAYKFENFSEIDAVIFAVKQEVTGNQDENIIAPVSAHFDKKISKPRNGNGLGVK